MNQKEFTEQMLYRSAEFFIDNGYEQTSIAELKDKLMIDRQFSDSNSLTKSVLLKAILKQYLNQQKSNQCQKGTVVKPLSPFCIWYL